MSVLEGLEPTLVWKHFDEIRKIPRCSKHEEKIRKYLLDFAKAQELEAKTDDAGNIVIKKPAASGMENRPIVVLQSHMDMVCEKNNDVKHDFSKDPIQLKLEQNILTADGTTLGADDGIGVAVSLALLEDDTLSLGGLEALFTVDEETGLTGAFALGSDMLEGRLLLNLDSEDWGVVTVGCAGGGNSELKLPYKTEKLPKDVTCIVVNITGLRGGHSGVDIHEQRGNAVKLLARILYKIMNKYSLHLIDIKGGDKHNAIPRESYAIIAIPEKQEKIIREYIKKEEEAILAEIKPIDPKFTVSIKKAEPAKEAFDASSQKTLLDLLQALPHGVYAMSYELKDKVESSTNLAHVKLNKNNVEILYSSRSSIMSALYNIRDEIKATAELAGASVKEDEAYPGWKPNLESRLLKLAIKLYKENIGKEPIVETIHAGLECGIIGEKFDGMEMISIGPTIKYPHSPEEQVHIDTVDVFYEYVLDILKTV